MEKSHEGKACRRNESDRESPSGRDTLSVLSFAESSLQQCVKLQPPIVIRNIAALISYFNVAD